MQPQTQSYIHVGGHQHLRPEQIVRLEADRNYTHIYKADGRTLLVSITLKVVEARLMAHGFLRITRGDVINLAFVKKIWKDGAIQLLDGTLIYPSRRRQGVVKGIFKSAA
ncbi:MAG: LytTR family transcriptional regulator [Bacteroidetes bacterium]|nr:LytTR family transcriptional regulator [Bacteroidota bacterium]